MANSRRKATGRSGTAQFHMMPTSLLRSQTWATLPAIANKLFWDLYYQFNGFNNGDLSMQWSLMKKRGWKSRNTLWRAQVMLLERGLITKTKQGGKGIGPTLIAVTIQPIDECGGKLEVRSTNRASNEWRKGNAAR